MQIIYVSTLTSKNKSDYLINDCNIKMLQSVQKYHRLLCEGLIANNYEVTTLTSLPISHHNSNKKFWNEKNEIENNIKYNYLPFINLPILRQFCLFLFTLIYVLYYIIFSKEKPVFICDILNTTISSITLFLAKLFGCKCVAIVTDLPKDMTGSKKSSIIINNLLQSHYDYYILLSKYMNNIVNKKNRPFTVIEGIADDVNNVDNNNFNEKYIMYAGGLYEQYGLKDLIDGFIEANLEDVKLYIYGSGKLENYIKNINNDKVIFGGVLTNDEIVQKEINASLLVNPRYSSEEYTKYSFPSKNIEYMASGTPVLTTKLLGIPEEYNEYTFILENENKDGIKNKLKEIFSMSAKSLRQFGKNAQKFVIEEKNKKKQAKKVKDLLNCNTNKTKVYNSKIINYYGYFLLFLSIILSRNTIINNNLIGLYNSTYIITFLYLPLIYIYLLQKKFKNIDFILLLMLVLMFFGLILKNDFKPYNLYIILNIMLSYIYISMFSFKNILKWFCFIMVFLSCYSFLSEYFIYPILVNNLGIDNLLSSSIHFSNSVGTNFLNMIFSFPVIKEGYIRNFGVFTEPGYYQFYLILAMLIVQFRKDLFKKEINNIMFCIFLITLISTFSAAGIICVIIILIYMFVYQILQIKKEKGWKDVIIFLLITAVLLLLVAIVVMSNNSLESMWKVIIGKILGNSSSTSTRLNGILYTLQLGLKNPLFGVNIYTVIDRMIIANTNFAFMALYGIFCEILLVIMQYRFSEKVNNNKICTFIILLVILLSVNNHFFVAIQSFWILILLGLKEEQNENFMENK